MVLKGSRTGFGGKVVKEGRAFEGLCTVFSRVLNTGSSGC